ncbi:4'-phosphopantetheinyl transferase family protein [Rathayibacter rathayi]|uniref:4'-phosphopantetheinyl transferase family protein n=1 Tax=Rathayibacter rathayi TaxID=33887 RepID=UPI000BDBFCF2|nr:4'-phosphopantetheinyl transferase superfamily protein [Rathayibacter rathayi]MWV74651.1 4'-phosphopantetheinyl transferase superfamily protein [Rathayibacter rathayi NCPPB 2980 = VKM Ac-1601]TWD64511.1 4'-phosphopantetheinyl transferase [Rathayibacter rathayi]SOE04325.1 4'-phosphopantetheinyl transferase superfamily protein [Rathayibacter rathayi NCPPB 2980 = VKM Ac-1601]
MWQQAVRGASAEDRALLDRVETERAARYLRASDRDRFVTAAVTLRRAVAAVTGLAAAEVVVDRTCVGCGRPHGKTRLKTLGIEASLSHAGEVVAVALTTIGPVGVDVERVAEIDFARLDEQITAPGELASASRLEVFQRWTRKEAVLKAVGTGRTPPWQRFGSAWRKAGTLYSLALARPTSPCATWTSRTDMSALSRSSAWLRQS